MTRDEKSKIVAELGEAFKASEAIVISDFKGLSVKQLEDLRNSAREAGVKVRVIKDRKSTRPELQSHYRTSRMPSSA